MSSEPSIVCPRCGRRSFNSHDIAEKYCGACHLFHEQMVQGEQVFRKLYEAAAKEFIDKEKN